MKIRAKLFQFSRPALLIVLDGETGKLYSAFDGIVDLRETRKHVPHKPEGRKPLLRSSGHGRVFRAGAPTRESSRVQSFAPLVKELNEAALALRKKEPFEYVYLFAPQHLLAEATRRLPVDLRKRLKRSFGADLVHDHPRTLVEKISSELAL